VGIPHLSAPLTLGRNGAFVVNEQDSVDDLAECVAALLATPVGSRIEVPDYGVDRAEFVGPDPGAIIAAAAEWEKRVDLTLDVATGLGDAGGLTQITAAVRPHV